MKNKFLIPLLTLGTTTLLAMNNATTTNTAAATDPLDTFINAINQKCSDFVSTYSTRITLEEAEKNFHLAEEKAFIPLGKLNAYTKAKRDSKTSTQKAKIQKKINDINELPEIKNYNKAQTAFIDAKKTCKPCLDVTTYSSKRFNLYKDLSTIEDTYKKAIK